MTRGPVPPRRTPDDRPRPSGVQTRQRADGARISVIRRPDGSTLTVTVPASAMEDETGATDGTVSWIRDDAAREPPAFGLTRLAALVTVGRSRHADTSVRPALALRLT